MMYAPLGLCVVGSPVLFGSNGHIIIQWGPTSIAGLVYCIASPKMVLLAVKNLRRNLVRTLCQRNGITRYSLRTQPPEGK